MTAPETRLTPREPAGAEAVKASAKRIAPRLKVLAPEAEQSRRLTREGIDLVRDHGLFKTLQPERSGGHQLTLRTHLDVVSALSEGCVSTGWVVGVAHAHSWLIGHMSRQAQDDVYANNPNAFVAAVVGPRGKAVKHADGSFQLNGFWPFGSGSDYADWLMLGAEVVDENGQVEDWGDFLIPPGDIDNLNDWHSAGLAGTGSHSLVGKDVTVPSHRFISMPALFQGHSPGKDLHEGTLYKSSAAPVLALALTGSAIGCAKASLADYRDNIQGKVMAYTDHVQTEWPPTQMNAANAATRIDAAELLLYRSADTIDNYAARDTAMPVLERARVRMDCAQAVRFCLEAVDLLFINGGASGLARDKLLQRASRDLHAINMHGLLLLDVNAEAYGRILLGLEPNSPLI